jgi:acyl carrier protein
MTIDQRSTADTVRALVVQQLNLSAHGDQPDPEDNLWDLGMTSLTCLGLLLSVEDAFGVELPEDALKESTFRTLTTISAAIEAARMSEAGATAPDIKPRT